MQGIWLVDSHKVLILKIKIFWYILAFKSIEWLSFIFIIINYKSLSCIEYTLLLTPSINITVSLAAGQLKADSMYRYDL